MENCTRNRLCSLQCVRGVVDTSKYHFRGFCFTTKNISGILCLLYNAFATRYSLLHSHFGSLDALISPMTDIMSSLARKFNLFHYSFFDCISSNFCKFGLQQFLLQILIYCKKIEKIKFFLHKSLHSTRTKIWKKSSFFHKKK